MSHAGWKKKKPRQGAGSSYKLGSYDFQLLQLALFFHFFFFFFLIAIEVSDIFRFVKVIVPSGSFGSLQSSRF